MVLAPLKTLGLAILLLLPSSVPARAGGDPPEEEVVIAEDSLLAFEDDEDEPLVLRHRIHDRGGFIGVRVLDMTPELRAHYGAPRDAGILVNEVEPDTPAARAGIQVGDIITEVSGARIDSPHEIFRAVRGKKAGESLEIEVIRNRSTKRLAVTVEERKGSRLGARDLFDKEHGLRRFRVRDLDSVRPLLGREDLSRLREKMDEMEKRLKELEKKVGGR